MPDCYLSERHGESAFPFTNSKTAASLQDIRRGLSQAWVLMLGSQIDQALTALEAIERHLAGNGQVARQAHLLEARRRHAQRGRVPSRVAGAAVTLVSPIGAVRRPPFGGSRHARFCPICMRERQHPVSN